MPRSELDLWNWLLTEDIGFEIDGVEKGDRSGWSVSSAADFYGDGLEAVIIGAPFADKNGSNSGQSYILYKSTSYSLTLELNGIKAGDNSGFSVSSAGDFNGDGLEDIIIGAPGADTNGENSGESYVVFGIDVYKDVSSARELESSDRSIELSSLNGVNGFKINGINAGDRSGSSVASAGDFNGDGLDDIIIGAPGADPNGENSGESYVIFGSDSLMDVSLDLKSLDGTNGFSVNSINYGVGRSVSSAGDFNGDGLDDLIISSYAASHIIYGSQTFADPSLDLLTIDGSNGFTINDINTGDNSGFSISSAGDFNGDGLDDIIIGAPGADPNGENSGQSYIIYGSKTFSDLSLDLVTLDGTNGFTINGINAGDGSGGSVSSAGDFNGDGLDDIIIGATGSATRERMAGAGQGYVIFGSSVSRDVAFNLESLNGYNGFVINGAGTSHSTGNSVSSAGDFNGDGLDDIIIGATGAEGNTGKSYLIYGQSGLPIILNNYDGKASEDTLYTHSISARAAYVGDSITLSIEEKPDWLSFEALGINLNYPDVSNGRLSGTPTNNDVGSHSVVWRATDNATGKYVDQSFSLNVTNRNDLPVITSDALTSVNEDALYKYYLTFSDVDVGDSLTCSAEVKPDWLDFDSDTGILSGTPTNDEVGNHAVVLRVTDNSGGYAEQSFSINVYNINDAPTLPLQAEIILDEDRSFSADLGAVDVDNDTLLYTIEEEPAFGTATVAPDGVYSYKPNNNFNGSDSFTIAVSDGTISIIQDISVTIVAVNDAPTAPATASLTTFEDTTMARSVNAFDVDGDTLTYSFSDPNKGFITSNNDGTYAYTPNANANGIDLFTITVSDGTASIIQDVSVTINAVNDSPLLSSTKSLTTTEDTTVNGSVDALDVDGDKLTYSFSDPTKGFITNNNDGTYSYTPIADVNGTDFFTITVSDGTESITQDVSVTINAVNDAPIATLFTLNLSNLGERNGVQVNGANPSDGSGVSVSAAGDFNGDGLDDVIIGAVNADPYGKDRAGESYVIFGSTSFSSPSLDLSSLNGSNGFKIDGLDRLDRFGSSVSTAGDFNGDGLDDIIIGALDNNNQDSSPFGKSYVIFGSNNFSSPSFDLSSLNGSNGFQINGIEQRNWSGVSISTAGDFNGDGLDDIIIGANGAFPDGKSYAGKSYVIFGSTSFSSPSLDLSSLNGSNGFQIDGLDRLDRFGSSVSTAGDFNGDGLDDIIIGAYYADPKGKEGAGESYIIFGTTNFLSPSLDLSSLNGSNGFQINGIDHSDASGQSVSTAGDFNGDGLDDIIIGAYYADPNGKDRAGESYIIFGTTNFLSPSLDLSSLNGGNGFQINGIDIQDYSGVSVSTAGDFNGDGLDDIIIGANDADPNDLYSAGESYIIFGSTNFSSPSVDLSSLNGGNGFQINGIDPGDNSGYSVSTAGDFNGDGLDDIVIGASGADPHGKDRAGESYIIFGSSSPFSYTSYIVENSDISNFVYKASAFDVDGDTLIYDLSGPDASWFTIDGSSGVVSLKEPADYEVKAQYNFTVTVFDGSLSDKVDVTLNVTNVNDAPVASSTKSLTTDEDTAVAGSVDASDVDGDTLTYLFSDPSKGIITNNNDGTYTYTPNANANGSDSFTITISDGTASITQDVNILIEPAVSSEADWLILEPQRATVDELILDVRINGAKLAELAPDLDFVSILAFTLDYDSLDEFEALTGSDDIASFSTKGTVAFNGNNVPNQILNDALGDVFQAFQAPIDTSTLGASDTFGFVNFVKTPAVNLADLLASTDAFGVSSNDGKIGELVLNPKANGPVDIKITNIYIAEDPTPILSDPDGVTYSFEVGGHNVLVNYWSETSNAEMPAISNQEFVFSSANSTVTATTDATGTLDAQALLSSTYTAVGTNTSAESAISISDVIATLKAAVGISELSTYQKLAADVTQDDQVTISDVISVLKIAVGIEEGGTLILTDQGNDEFTITSNTTELTAVALGDVDGSWANSAVTDIL